MQIAQKFVGENPSVIVPISTPSAQAVVNATSEIPVVFTAVTDPLGAKLVSDMMHPGGNVTGMSDLSPIKKHLELIKEITPNATKIGVPYNPGEANSVTLLGLLKQYAPEMGLEIVEAAAPTSADVLAAAQSLVGKADVIYVPTDNTIVSALESVIKVGTDNQVPVYAGDTDSVPRGAIAALGFNYYDVGRQTGKIVLRVLNGEKPGDIPVEGVETTELYVNFGCGQGDGRDHSRDRRRAGQVGYPVGCGRTCRCTSSRLLRRGEEGARSGQADEHRRLPRRRRARPRLRPRRARRTDIVPRPRLP